MSSRVFSAINTVTEERHGDVPLFVQPEWARAFPWLVQGTSARTGGDFASFGARSAEQVHAQWQALRARTGAAAVVMGRQIHGAGVATHGPMAAGLLVADGTDGHITRATGVLLAVTVADCVPVFIVDAMARTVAILHAGWRGTAAGIARACTALLGTNIHVHLGPAICGDCYEVGPEVHAALGLPVPAHSTPIDLRLVLSEQLLGLGVAPTRLTRSTWCTRCGDSPFYSHRAGHPERQAGVIGLR